MPHASSDEPTTIDEFPKVGGPGQGAERDATHALILDVLRTNRLHESRCAELKAQREEAAMGWLARPLPQCDCWLADGVDATRSQTEPPAAPLIELGNLFERMGDPTITDAERADAWGRARELGCDHFEVRLDDGGELSDD